MSGRVNRHLSFLARCVKDNTQVSTATAVEVECLVEIIYNIINNEGLFLTDREIKVLQPVRPLLVEIARIRSAEDARCEILRLSARQLKTIIVAAIEITSQQ